MRAITSTRIPTLVALLALAASVTPATAQIQDDRVALEAASDLSLSSFFVRSVRVTADVLPTGNYADIGFSTREPAHSAVEVSTTRLNDFAPTVPAGQQPPPAFRAGAVTMAKNDALGEKRTQHSFRLDGLGPNRTYFYVITTTGPDGRTFRYGGSFQTSDNRRVKVVFEKINFTNKRLGLYSTYPNGKLTTMRREGLRLHGAINGQWGTPERGYWEYPRDGSFAEIGGSSGTGSYQPAGWEAVNIEAVVDKAPDQLELKLLAFDLHSTIGFNTGIYANPSFPSDPRPAVYGLSATDAGYESYNPQAFWSTAIGQVDTTVGGTHQSGAGSFRLVQTPEAIDDAAGALVFEVAGRFEVSYVKPRGSSDPLAIKQSGRVGALFNAPVKPQGRVRLPAGTVADRRPLSICDAARAARARSSPAAPGLEARCKAEGEQPPIDFDGLAAKGEAIASQDPLSLELRNQQPEGPGRMGFDIGMAVAEGQTVPGPGKQAIQNRLSPAEQGGFVLALAFSLDRNRNADLAARGAAIAAADASVAAARVARQDPLYWLGFDIATGIFGDPALGAQGNTATGPGSMGIRNALTPSAQQGFDGGVAFHLRRK